MAKYEHSNNHYINNDEFYQAMIKYRKQLLVAEESGTPKPRTPDYIAECIMKIANHLSYKPNFSGYTFREEFVLDAIENCLAKVDKFDPDKSNNPFWYFTKISHNAFVRRILEERKQTYIKGKIVASLPFDIFDIQAQDTDNSYANEFIELLQEHGAYNDVVEKEDQRIAKKKAKKASQANLTPLFEEDIEALPENE